MADRAQKRTAASRPSGVAKDQPTGLVDPLTLGLTAKGIYEAGKAGIRPVGEALRDHEGRRVALVCAVTDSSTIDDRFRLRMRLSSLCPHGIAINKITLGSLKDARMSRFRSFS